MQLATLFLFIFSIILTLAPAVRYQNWNAPYRWQHWIGFIVWLGLFSFTHRQSCRLIPDRDPFLLPLGAVLSGWGLLTIWRLSSNFGLRQTIWLAVSLAILNILLRVPNALAYLWRYKYLWLTSGLVLTALTFVFGTYPGGNGPHLWLGCCGVYIQPSEPLKLLLIAYLAAFLADRIPLNFTLWQIVLPTLVLSGLAFVLLLAQRDLGTEILFLAIYVAILYIATNRKRVVLFGTIIFIIAGILGYELISVVHYRVDAWINPWIDPTGQSYQIVQSLISIAAGGLFGRGPGLGSPGVVPVAQSDFIFSAISEETGLMGSIGLVLIMGLMTVRGLQVALRASDLYKRYLATGLTIYLASQSLLIVGGNLGLFPLTGITLPFLSYGGSSLLTSFLSLLLLLLISNQTELDPASLPHPKPYLQLGGALLVGLTVALLVDGWWAVVNNPTILNRNDNPRRVISDIYVKRGSLLDRDGNVLVGVTGAPGNYSIITAYPPLSPITGYTDSIYGQVGLEASLDDYLRGIQGYPTLTVLWNELLYGSPPPGLDVRLSLSLSLQKQADTQLANHSGAIVLLNAASGEILAMASHPYFDANTLEQNWADLVKDSETPLLNRTTLGLYPPGTILAPFYLAESENASLPSIPQSGDYVAPVGNTTLDCSLPVGDPFTWNSLIASGCPGAILGLTTHMDDQRILSLMRDLGFFTVPEIPLPSDSATIPNQINSSNLFALGQEGITVNPLQMALAAASLTAEGKRPSPLLAMAVNIPDEGWTVLSQITNPVQVFPADQAMAAVKALAVQAFPGWQAVGTAVSSTDKVITWYIGGTLPSWQGSPIVIALVLEEDNPALAEQIGQSLIKAAQNP
jgi:cell division protein FtsW (lipid II flippase)